MPWVDEKMRGEMVGARQASAKLNALMRREMSVCDVCCTRRTRAFRRALSKQCFYQTNKLLLLFIRQKSASWNIILMISLGTWYPNVSESYL